MAPKKAAQDKQAVKRKPDDDAAFGSRSSGKKAKKATTNTDLAALKYLLSDGPAKLLAGRDAKDEKLKDGERTYRAKPGDLTPFEELVCAVILARPISHRLGIRTIAVVLNEPYSFNTPKKMQDASDEQRRQALEDAATQHRQKTADQLGTLAEAVIDNFASSPTDTTLAKLQKVDADNLFDVLKGAIKGLGQTGIDIFRRRLQAYDGFGDKLFPFSDDKALDAVNEFDLPSADVDDLVGALKKHRKALELEDGDDAIRVAFAVVLDRAQQLSLDKLVGAAKKEIKKA